VTETRDFLLSNDFTVNSHTTVTCNKARRVFGFMRRDCSEFKNPYCYKTLHFTLVRPILEYGSVMGNPRQTGLIDKIERVQNRFLRVLAFKINKPGAWLKRLASDYV